MADGAVCPRDGEPSTGVCDRCGRFVCARCTQWQGDQRLCEGCAPRVAGLFSGSWLAVAAAICGFVSLGCGLLGPVAIVLAVVDLLRSAGGRGPRGGRGLDGLAIALGLAGLAVGVVVALRLWNGGLPAALDE